MFCFVVILRESMAKKRPIRDTTKAASFRVKGMERVWVLIGFIFI